MFNIGDKVFVEKTARIDVAFQAWSYIDAHPYGIVRCKMEHMNGNGNTVTPPESEQIYSVEFAEQFSGGTSCQGTCKQRQGQFITAKHLSLCFEDSCEVVTVPNIKRITDEKGSEST